MQQTDNVLEEKQFTLTEKQDQAIDLISSLASNILLYGGARSTKTFTFIRSTIIRALLAPKSRHLVARFRFNDIKGSVVRDTLPKVMELCFPGIPLDINKTDWFLTLPNKSEIWFCGLDDKERSDKILGREFATIFLNECSQISYDTYVKIITRLSQKCEIITQDIRKPLRLKMFFDENPPNKTHWSHRLFLEKKNPLDKTPLKNPDDYACLLMNPSDNVENLPESTLENLDNLPKRARDRFFLGKFTDNTENALWTEKIINGNRVSAIPEGVIAVRTVIAVDPSGASDNPEESNDDIGIGVITLGSDGIAYVLEDLTLNDAPAIWAKVVVSAYERHDADRVVGEENFGGAMVASTIEAAASKAKILVSYKSVRASKGKMVRAEPVSFLHETGSIKFVGRFDALEDELLSCTPSGYLGSRSPNRLDWFVWGIIELFPQLVSKPQREIPEIIVPPLKRFGYTGRQGF